MLRRRTATQTTVSRLNWRVAALCRLLTVTLLLPPQTAFAQSYQEGARKYTRGDIQGAESSLTLALRTVRAATERAKIYKLLGITQYMQNKRTEAARSFQQALALNPATRISKDEVLDESVVPFFDSQRQSARSTAQRQPAPQRQAASERAAAPARTPTRAPTRASAPRTAAAKPRAESSPRFGKPVNRTGITIQSNAKNAQIIIDGILAGNVGDRIEAQPGTTTVTMKAPGFKSKKFRIKVLANRENRYALNLSKAVPKKAPPRAVAKKERGVRKMDAADPDLFSEEGGGGGDELSGRDLMREFEAETAAAAQPARAPRRVPTRAPAPPPVPMAVVEAPPAPAMAAPAPAPSPQVPMNAASTPPPAPPNYAAPMYQAPPTYYAPQGYPGQPPVYYQPAPQGMVPQQQPVPQPMVQQGQMMAPPPEYYAQEPAAVPPPPPPPEPASTPRRGRKARNEAPNRFLLFLPLGVGQYANGSTFLGLAMTGGQLGALYFYFSSLDTADKAVANAQAVVASNEYTDDEKDQFVQDTEKFVRAQKANAQLGLLGFIALYGTGVIEANLSAPSGKSSRSRRADLGPYAPDLLPGETLDSVFVAEAVKDPGAVLRVGLIPNQSEPGAAGFGLGLDWTF